MHFSPFRNHWKKTCYKSLCWRINEVCFTRENRQLQKVMNLIESLGSKYVSRVLALRCSLSNLLYKWLHSNKQQIFSWICIGYWTCLCFVFSTFNLSLFNVEIFWTVYLDFCKYFFALLAEQQLSSYTLYSSQKKE